MFGELLRQAIAEAEAMFDHPLKQYALFKDFEEQVKSRQPPGTPDLLADKPHARAYFGVLRLVLGDGAVEAMDDTARQNLVAQALEEELTLVSDDRRLPLYRQCGLELMSCA